ncbi:LCP family protein [Planococcus lenghuensis]|uniref:Transcriptional regulator n=1 Tax=Planococcus lenghuensis TaxID=2213202 RepID=A0A1Q2L3X9_9BACL|nr:LCP family protein [Planococcus lenghuensis]AQQ55123.1 transcriptional regulator [Planococcus lenghuensis]
MNRKEYRRQTGGGKRTWLKWIITIAVTLLLAVSAYGIFLIKQAEQAANDSFESLEGRDISDLRTEEVEPLDDNVSVLFMGLDNSEKRNQQDNNTRTDALILATLNNQDKSVKLVSIPRDSYAYIPEIGTEDKITHAYAYGGAESTIETVEELFDVPVDYYVKMDFNAFVASVDALGGITVEVPYALDEANENDQQDAIQLRPGIQKVNGSEALALARTRYYDNDIERGKRQQMILEAILNKVLSVSSVFKYGDVIDAVGENVKTDLTFKDMQAFIEYAQGGHLDIENFSLAGYDDMSTGTYYWKLDEDALIDVSNTLQKHLEFQPNPENTSSS